MTKLFDKIGPGRVEVVWSMWRGYWDRDGCALRTWAAHGVGGGGSDPVDIPVRPACETRPASTRALAGGTATM
ncbi:MAG: hypothetical protein U1E29_18080 [Coriobacteriia bacterium]|nr:hypothetical protein [Coriobacteriia bacterium]